LQDKAEKTPPPLKIDFTRRRVKLFPWNCNTALEEGYIYATAKNVTVEKNLGELNQQTRL
jgi:hypothetical protein